MRQARFDPTRDTEVNERYRGLRASVEALLLPAAGDGSALTMLVVGVDSAVERVGFRLASTFAAADQRTLLVLTNPQSEKFVQDLPGDLLAPPGLAEWLARGAYGDKEPAPIRSTGIEHLDLIAPGIRPAVGDPLPGDRVNCLFADLSKRYDRIVVASADLDRSADGLLLARHLAGVLLVMVPGKTEGPTAVRARNALQHAGGNVLGVVLDDAPRR